LRETTLKASRAVRKILNELLKEDSSTEIFALESGIDKDSKKIVTVCAYGQTGSSQIVTALSDTSPSIPAALAKAIDGRRGRQTQEVIAKHYDVQDADSIRCYGLTTLASG